MTTLAGNALGVKRPGPQAAVPKRIVDDVNAGRKNLLAELLAQETGLARDRAAIRGAGEVSNHRTGNSGVKHDRHAAGRHLMRIEAFDRTLASAAADGLRVLEIGSVQRRGKIVVALHPG